jgi:hypothetical protein
MKTERLLLTMIVAAAIFVIPSVLTSPVLAQGTTDTAEGNQGTTGGAAADDESPSEMYQTFQSCLEDAEGGAAGAGGGAAGAAGAEAFADEEEIRECFINTGYTGAGDDNEDENDNEDDEDEDDEDENEDDGETN